MDGGCVQWTPTSVAPSEAGFGLGREPTTHAVGYRLSVLRTCRGRQEYAHGHVEWNQPQDGNSSRLLRPRLSVKGKGRQACKPHRGWEPRQWGRVYKLYICRHTGRQ